MTSRASTDVLGRGYTAGASLIMSLQKRLRSKIGLKSWKVWWAG
jgi:hypothetical protein